MTETLSELFGQICVQESLLAVVLGLYGDSLSIRGGMLLRGVLGALRYIHGSCMVVTCLVNCLGSSFLSIYIL